ncbi:MAG TPA: hypothetical protein VFQ68_08095 [Streptosporangiaceae bacterium]|nr:hypothetical protein [Streptosporangiaceae bacterium]
MGQPGHSRRIRVPARAGGRPGDGGGRVSRALREIAAPFVAAAPAGARVRTRLRVSPEDAAVLTAVGCHLGSLAGRDLAARCAEGRLDAKGRAASRAVRKRALTAESSSRWAGAITRASEDAWQLAARNLSAELRSLQARVRKVEARLAVPAGTRQGRTAGYATPAERHGKTLRLKALRARLARVERQAEAAAVSVTRGGRRLMRARLNLAGAGLTEGRWREHWEAARLFITADGEAAKAWGNETIRVNHDEGWLELKLPAPLAGLANRPHGRYRLTCPVEFSHRGDEAAAQAASGAVRYDVSCDAERGRWYLAASWKKAPAPAVTLEELRAGTIVAIDVNAGHQPLVSRSLAGPDARAAPRDDRPPRRGTGDRETRTRPPGQDPREREPHRPSGRDAASPGAIPETPGGQALTKETRRPTRPTAAARR